MKPSIAHKSLALLVLASALTATSASAAPPTKDECVDAHTKSQSLKRTGKLREAKRALQICVQASCPALVKDDCTTRLDEVERLLPTVVFEVKDAAGKDVTAIKVTMDSEPFAESLDGTALAVDAGEHSFTFEASGHPPTTQKFLFREGDRGRREKITLPDAAVTTEPSPAKPAARGGLQRTLGLTAGAVGLVGVGLGAFFGLSASSSWSNSESACRTGSDCVNRSQALLDHDDARSAATLSTIGFVAGGVLLAGGVVLYLTAPKGESTTNTGLRLVPSFGASGAGMQLGGAF